MDKIGDKFGKFNRDDITGYNYMIYIVHRPARERELSTDIFPARER